jgi:hypothetical protein
MAASLTEQEFSQHVGTNFQLKLVQGTVNLNLSKVKGYPSGPNEQTGMERFSAFFDGPPDPRLPQAVYQLEHERMGQFELFLVPVAKNDQGFQYEAVFNYFKNKSTDT